MDKRTSLRSLVQRSACLRNINAREIVRWAFNKDTDIDQVSNVFETEEQYVVAVLTGKSKKDSPSIEDFRNELTAKVRNQAKSEQITKKLRLLLRGHRPTEYDFEKGYRQSSSFLINEAVKENAKIVDKRAKFF
ncbi:MAG: hypothetical protein EAY79_10655 [Runella slithyformis]|nr:MAG: hypothetical protein EAY79_10655 [Runella slithyformis]